jgi:uncharacterized protein (TIGR04255 family)
VVERVIYEVNPLEEVTCQLRFPPILSIDATPPVAFQDAVRDEFPFFELKSSVKLPAGVPPGISQIVERDLSLVGSKSYAFTSENRAWTLTLAKDGLSLTCRQYRRWEEFRVRLGAALESFARAYRPTFFLHTCVRYKNSIRRGPLGLATTPWSALVRPWVSGPLDPADTSSDVEAMQTRSVIRLPDGVGRVEATGALGVHQPSMEPAFIIEAHVYHEDRKVLNDVLPRLDALNRQAGSFFRWCITDELHRAMRPTAV